MLLKAFPHAVIESLHDHSERKRRILFWIKILLLLLRGLAIALLLQNDMRFDPQYGFNDTIMVCLDKIILVSLNMRYSIGGFERASII